MEYSLLCFKLKLNETQPELEKKQEELGLSGETSQRENVYGIK